MVRSCRGIFSFFKYYLFIFFLIENFERLLFEVGAVLFYWKGNNNMYEYDSMLLSTKKKTMLFYFLYIYININYHHMLGLEGDLSIGKGSLFFFGSSKAYLMAACGPRLAQLLFFKIYFKFIFLSFF